VTIEPRALRDAAGVFATGVAVITTLDARGEKIGFTANSFASVSLSPPLVSFNLSRNANSLAAFTASTHFAVNILADDQEALSRRFASREDDKWQGVATTVWETGSPILEAALASFDCERHAVLEGGDHLIFLGRVLRLAAREGEPLLFFRGGYRELAPARK